MDEFGDFGALSAHLRLAALSDDPVFPRYQRPWADFEDAGRIAARATNFVDRGRLDPLSCRF